MNEDIAEYFTGNYFAYKNINANNFTYISNKITIEIYLIQHFNNFSS